MTQARTGHAAIGIADADKAERALHEFVAGFYDDPLGFVIGCYQWPINGVAGPDRWQREVVGAWDWEVGAVCVDCRLVDVDAAALSRHDDGGDE